jgi:hypothetical protein
MEHKGIEGLLRSHSIVGGIIGFFWMIVFVFILVKLIAQQAWDYAAVVFVVLLLSFFGLKSSVRGIGRAATWWYRRRREREDPYRNSDIDR